MRLALASTTIVRRQVVVQKVAYTTEEI